MNPSPDSDRQSAALAALGFERVSATPVVTDVQRANSHSFRVTVTRPAMGTAVRVTAITTSTEHVEDAVGRAMEDMDRLIGIFSHYDDASAASDLNASGYLDAPPEELVDVLARAQDVHRLTGGSFDVSVAPLVDLFERGAPGSLPSDAEVREALALVGAEHIVTNPRRLVLQRGGMRVTLDGIAKGYIVDAVARDLTRQGIRDFLVEGGGDIRASGTKERGQPWVVAVEDPDKAGAFPDTIRLSGGAVATSGSYERYFGSDESHHHIVNAATGLSPQHCRSVSVLAPTAMEADALATGVFVMPPEQGVAFIGALPGHECLILGVNGEQWCTPGWRAAARIIE